MMRRSSFAILFLILMMASSAHAIGPVDHEDVFMDDFANHQYGQTVTISRLSFNSSGELIGGILGNCTGVYVEPGIVLTAGHCFSNRILEFLSSQQVDKLWVTNHPASNPLDFVCHVGGQALSNRFGIGRCRGNVNPEVHHIAVDEFYVSNSFTSKQRIWSNIAVQSHDLAVLVLKEDMPGITPARRPQAGLLDDRQAMLKEPFVQVGFGMEGTGHFHNNIPDPQKRYYAAPIGAIGAGWFAQKNFDGPTGPFTCFGDSGGPSFLGGIEETSPDTAAPIVIGLNWGGGENNAGLCELEANKKRQRIDTAEEIDFIDGIIDAIAAGEEPCTLGLMFQYTEDLFGEGQCYPYDAVTEF